MAREQTRLEMLQEEAKVAGLYVCTYSPGDGLTRYRFFDKPGNSYFGPANGIYTALGLKEAQTYLAGYARARSLTSDDSRTCKTCDCTLVCPACDSEGA